MSPINHLSEETLIDLLKRKDQRGFNYLYDNYSGALYAVVYRIVLAANYAEEVIQDVFVKIWRNIHLFESDKGKLYTWMINIARHTAIDFIKSKSVRNEQKNQSLTNFVNSTEEHLFIQTDLETRLDYIGFKNVLNKLKPEWRMLIEMAYYEGYTQQEIAEALQVPLGTIKTRTRSALLELQKVLIEYR